MSLPAPNLDDRRFQDLVDDAKRLVQRTCPEWSDHNVSDPGVTLIETFAYMVDQLIYRLNRVPDRHYVKFLDLIGVRMYPPTAAEVPVTFWLSAPQPEPVTVRAGTEVATVRTETEEAITFATTRELSISPCAVSHLASSVKEGDLRHHPETVAGDAAFLCFDRQPKPGDTLLIGLDNAVPSCAVVLRFEGQIEGVGVLPDNPPIVWEAWVGNRWAACEVDHDDTGGLNRAGDIVLHVPPGHVTSMQGQRQAGWLRCRVVATEPGQPGYTESPEVRRFSAHTIGGTVQAMHADTVANEPLGRCEGVPGQRFQLRQRPVVPSDVPVVCESTIGEGWEEWHEVTHFAESTASSRHFVLDRLTGEILLGPAVREEGGSLRQFGAVPPRDAEFRVRAYRTGGGRSGNVSRGAIRVLKTSIPYIAQVENRWPAAGGVDGETIENAKLRGPLFLHTRNLAVTTTDYEQLAREAAPAVARVRCVGTEAGGGLVRLLVVPAATDNALGALHFPQLVPTDEALSTIAEYLDDRRSIGARVVVEPPIYQGITVVARLRARPRADPEVVQRDALSALYRYFHPIRGGPEATGWPFGRPVHIGEVYGALQRTPGVELVEDARLYPADPITRQRGEQTQRLELDARALVFSYEHQVQVRAT
ncbi:MAG: putative baseplate assembly protein [Egibacteraceae bacterium]